MSMKLGIMQPYFFPYIGYFHLMNAVDAFVVYDDIEYTKKGWINRNRILVNGSDAFITLPLKKASDFLDVKDRFLADSWSTDRKSMLQRVAAAYRKAPYFPQAYAVFERCVLFEERNLFAFIFHSLNEIAAYLGIGTRLIQSSTLEVDRQLRSQDRVIATCKRLQANVYVNPIGGTGLYSHESFAEEGIALHFVKTMPIAYQQLGNTFVPALSILDVMMFNSTSEIERHLTESYALI